jgi:hypothetical protein
MHPNGAIDMDKLRIPRTWAGTIGVAVLATLMVGVVIFGATNLRPLGAGSDGTDQTAATARTDKAATAGHSAYGMDAPDREGDEAHQGTDGEGDKPTDEPQSDKPKGDPDDKHKSDKPKSDKPQDESKADEPKADEPKDEPAYDEPKDEPASDHLGLGAWVKEGKVKLAWSKFSGEGFTYYKVVRSKDQWVTWPLGEKDTLIAAVGDRSATWAVDPAPCGHEFHYRVFAVHAGEDGYTVLAASNPAGAFVKCGEDGPVEPKHLGMDVWQTETGDVKLAWEACGADSFVYYKVVRSATNEEPTYPLADGDELLAAIGDPGQTTFKDTNVEPGQTWFYRVLSFGEGGVLLGATDGVAFTVE